MPPPGSTLIRFTLNGSVPIVAGTLDDMPVRLSMDTGSRASLTMKSPFVRAHDLVTRYAAAPEAVTGWGFGGAARSRPARFGTLQLGDLAIHNIAGNPGGGILHRFTAAFDYANKNMSLAPDAAFGTPCPFDRSGLWLLGDDDAPKVVAGAAASAALRAGLRDSDRLAASAASPSASATIGAGKSAKSARH